MEHREARQKEVNVWPGQFDKVMKLNINAIFYAVQPAVKIMKEQGEDVF